jgi:hypothetical protein
MMNLNFIVLLIGMSFCLVMFFFTKWYIKKRTSTFGLLPDEKIEVSRLIMEINAVTDRNLLLIEDKIKQLKEILDDTDKRISVYVKELEKSRTGEALYTNLGRGIRAALKTEAEAEADASAPLSNVRPNLEVKPKAAPVVEIQPELQFDKNKLQSKRHIHNSIDLLANEGLPPEEIASRLDISIAEVGLAMNLRRRKN